MRSSNEESVLPRNEDFTLVNANSHHKVFDDYEELFNAHLGNPDTFLRAALRRQYPGLNLTATQENNVPLLYFAAAGFASADLDITDESIQRFRYFFAGNAYLGTSDQLGESRTFAKYNYKWGDEYYIVYVIQFGYSVLQYILKEPSEGETTISTNAATDKLVQIVGKYVHRDDDKSIYVYDGYWAMSRPLYDEVQKAKWEDVILNEGMKKVLTELMHNFFDSKDIYGDLGVPWKRGVIFHGPAGNGKTISIKALMHSLFERSGFSIPSLYVKSAPRTYDIRMIFTFARLFAPCLLIFEDIDTIVTPSSRSYFFNEVDGLENNDGLFMVASTNHLDQLDPGLSSRPSRFDRKYLFPLPDQAERTLYCEYWRKKLQNKPTIKFPEKLSPAIAEITEDFSFAYLKEAFVASLLVIAGKRTEVEEKDGGGEDLDDCELWREIQKQVKALRDDMGNQGAKSPQRAMTRISTYEDPSWRKSVDEVVPEACPATHTRQSLIEKMQTLSVRNAEYSLNRDPSFHLLGGPVFNSIGGPLSSFQMPPPQHHMV